MRPPSNWTNEQTRIVKPEICMHAPTPQDLIQHRVDDRGEHGCVAYITVNNPAKRNTLGIPGKRAIAETFNTLAKNERIRVAVITGAGDKSFIAGADIAEMKDLDAAQAEVEHTLTHVAIPAYTLIVLPLRAIASDHPPDAEYYPEDFLISQDTMTGGQCVERPE